jgi:Ca2+/Na+ antiporter
MLKFFKGRYFTVLLVFSLAVASIGLLIKSGKISWESAIPLGVASFVVGCAMPLLTSCIMRILSKSNNMVIPGVVDAVAFIVGYGVGSGALVYLSTFDKSAAPVIALTATCGVGVVRLIRKEL